MSKDDTVHPQELTDSENVSVFVAKRDEFVYHPTVIAGTLNSLMGQTLQIIDASFSNERQCEAIKDLVKRNFYNAPGNITAKCIEPYAKDLVFYRSLINKQLGHRNP